MHGVREFSPLSPSVFSDTGLATDYPGRLGVPGATPGGSVPSVSPGGKGGASVSLLARFGHNSSDSRYQYSGV